MDVVQRSQKLTETQKIKTHDISWSPEFAGHHSYRLHQKTLRILILRHPQGYWPRLSLTIKHSPFLSQIKFSALAPSYCLLPAF